MARCGTQPTERRPILAELAGMSARGAAAKLDKRGLPMRVGAQIQGMLRRHRRPYFSMISGYQGFASRIAARSLCNAGTHR